MLADTQAASVATNWIAIVAPYVVTLVAACVGAGISLVTTSKNAENAREIQDANFAREARAVRLSTIAALRDLLQYATAAAALGHFNRDLWEPSAEVLVKRITEPPTVHGFDDAEWAFVAAAASEARLGVVRLQGLPPNPFLYRLDRTNNEVDGDQVTYMMTIRDVGERLHARLSQALGKIGDAPGPIPVPDVTELVDSFRIQIGQARLDETRQAPSAMCAHREITDPGPST